MALDFFFFFFLSLSSPALIVVCPCVLVSDRVSWWLFCL